MSDASTHFKPRRSAAATQACMPAKGWAWAAVAFALAVASGPWGMAAAQGVASQSASQASPTPAAPALAPLPVPEKDRRGANRTYLDFAQSAWSASGDEMAAALERGALPSSLPWISHARQAWSDLSAMSSRAKEGGAGMGALAAIGAVDASMSVDYALRAVYETTVGRVFESAFGHKTAEDALEVKEARRYAEFVKVRPWREFDFADGLARLWDIGEWDEPLKGSVPRRLERLFKLTVEWGAQGAVAWAASAAAGIAPPAANTLAGLRLPDGSRQLAPLPRGSGFAATAIALAGQGVDFESVAGNAGPMVVSVLVAESAWLPAEVGKPLLVQPVPTRRAVLRLAVEIPPSQLGAFLRWAAKPESKAEVERIFDF